MLALQECEWDWNRPTPHEQWTAHFNHFVEPNAKRPILKPNKKIWLLRRFALHELTLIRFARANLHCIFGGGFIRHFFSLFLSNIRLSPNKASRGYLVCQSEWNIIFKLWDTHTYTYKLRSAKVCVQTNALTQLSTNHDGFAGGDSIAVCGSWWHMHNTAC